MPTRVEPNASIDELQREREELAQLAQSPPRLEPELRMLDVVPDIRRVRHTLFWLMVGVWLQFTVSCGILAFGLLNFVKLHADW